MAERTRQPRVQPKGIRLHPRVPRLRRLTAGAVRVCLLCLLVGGLLVACGGETPTGDSESPTPAAMTAPPTAPPSLIAATPEGDSGSPTPSATTAPPTTPEGDSGSPTPAPATVSPTAPPPPATAAPEGYLGTPWPPGECRLGTGLREDTAPIVVAYGHGQGLVMAASIGLAEVTFPKLEGWIRVLGAPSLEELNRKAQEAEARGIPYEALGYGLETSKSTPDAEWQDLIGSTEEARAVADRYGKLLVMGPGFRLMAENWDAYPAMAGLADIWLFQTQQLQKEPPGPAYREQVEAVVNQIRAGHPGIPIWAQITLPPDRPPDAEEWLAYAQTIADLVEGRTYVAAYTWESADPAQLAATIEAVFRAVCGEQP